MGKTVIIGAEIVPLKGKIGDFLGLARTLELSPTLFANRNNYAPNFEKVGDILVSACPCVCLCVCVYGASRYRLETSCMDSSWKNSRRIFLVFPELSPLVKLRPFDKQGDEIL